MSEDGMAEVTEADREKAAEIAGWPAKNWTELRDTIAAALAEERQKARDEVYRELAELAGQKWHVAPEAGQ